MLHVIRKLTFLLLAAAPLAACATVQPYSDGMPRDAASLTTETERRAEYDRDAIHDVGVRYGNAWLEVARNLDGDAKHVTLESFFPVIEAVSPGVAADVQAVDALRAKRRWADAATGVGLGAMIFGPISVLRTAGAIAVAGGVGGSFALQHWEREELQKIQRRFNADLMRQLYGRADVKPSI